MALLKPSDVKSVDSEPTLTLVEETQFNQAIQRKDWTAYDQLHGRYVMAPDFDEVDRVVGCLEKAGWVVMRMPVEQMDGKVSLRVRKPTKEG